ncbi:MAG: hypothetical protein M1819_005144 [Sarea resinae]|nr:MAG: hypothetical protein M1819_005144 [Sarea resinae]
MADDSMDYEMQFPAEQESHDPKVIFMSHAVAVPFPTVEITASGRADREEKLKTIIQNLERHHADVRRNILALAQIQKQNILETQNAEEMRERSNVPPFGITRSENEDAVRMLGTEWNSKTPKPTVTAASWAAADHRMILPLSLTSKSSPLGEKYLALAQETVRKLEDYDRHATESVNYFKKALKKLYEETGREAEASLLFSGDSRRRTSEGGERRGSGSKASEKKEEPKGLEGQMGYDASRDPRLRR